MTEEELRDQCGRTLFLRLKKQHVYVFVYLEPQAISQLQIEAATRPITHVKTQTVALVYTHGLGNTEQVDCVQNAPIPSKGI